MADEEEATSAAPEEVEPDVRLRFVLTVEGDGAKGSITAEAWKYDKAGNLIEAAPIKQREAENVVIALYDGGIFFQTTSLLMGRTMALASGDLLRAIQIDATAAQLGLKLPPIEIDGLTDETDKATAEAVFIDTIEKALAG